MAIWIGKAIRGYTNPANWNPANVPDSAGETATFTNNGAPTAVSINNQTVSLGGFTFDAGAPTYTIRLFTPGGPQSLQFVGAGIVNNSGVAQNLSTGIFNGINFLASSTAGNATITVNTGAHLNFFDTSSGGTARIINGGFVGLATSSGALSIGSLEGSGIVLADTAAGGAATQMLIVGSLNTSTTYSGILGDLHATLGLTKVGTGTLVLSGNSTYTGPTFINGGTLQVDGDIIRGSPPGLEGTTIHVNSGGTLAGVGRVLLVDVNTGGTLSPGGAFAGKLTIASNLVFDRGTTLAIDLNSAGSYDRVFAARAHLDGTLTVKTGFVAPNFMKFTIMDTAAGLDGRFWDLGRQIVTDQSGQTFFVGINSTTVVLTALNDRAVANNDAFVTGENTVIAGRASVFADNGSGIDSDLDGGALDVTAVNGAGASVGTQITLPSGARLTLNANGRFSYDPNGAFDALPGPGSGASNTSDTDSFRYTVTGGDTATVTVTINGVDGDDILRGTTGNDSLTGGIGADIYFVENAGDAVNEVAGQGTDRVLASTSYMLAAGTSVEIMSTTNSRGTVAMTLTGNEFANSIYGNAGVNALKGGGGNDRLLGVGGDDILIGGAGDDRLYGGTGQNNMAGGTGNDWYIVDSASDVIVEAAGDARDRITVGVDYTLAAGVSVEMMMTRVAAGAVDLTGNELANTIYGNNGANVISGKGGNDALAGRGGLDTFVFDTAPNTTLNRDIIADFNGVPDTIRLAKSVFTELTGSAGTTLSTDQFVIGPDALDANDRIIYNNGTLNYDTNGNLAGGVQVIAFLSGKPALSNTDILLG